MQIVSNWPSAGLARTLSNSKACVLAVRLHCLPTPTQPRIWTSKALSPGGVQTLAHLSRFAVYLSPFLFPNRNRAEDMQQERRPERWRNFPSISQPPRGIFCPLALTTSFSLGGSHQASCLLLSPTSGKWEATYWILQNVTHLPRVRIVVGLVTLTPLFPRLWKARSQGNAWVFSKGEIIPVTNNNIYSYLSLDKGN